MKMKRIECISSLAHKHTHTPYFFGVNGQLCLLIHVKYFSVLSSTIAWSHSPHFSLRTEFYYNGGILSIDWYRYACIAAVCWSMHTKWEWTASARKLWYELSFSKPKYNHWNSFGTGVGTSTVCMFFCPPFSSNSWACRCGGIWNMCFVFGETTERPMWNLTCEQTAFWQ